jgi:hypothetical protein
MGSGGKGSKVARNFDQWTSLSCACVGQGRGRRALPCEWQAGLRRGLVGFRPVRGGSIFGLVWLMHAPALRSELVGASR